MDWAATYFDHYARYLGGNPGASHFFEPPGGEPPLQILTYNEVFPGVRLYGSLGLHRYADAVGRRVEVVAPVDDGFEHLPEVLAFTLFHLVATRTPIARGLSLQPHYELVRPEFVARFHKPAVYFQLPYGFPDGFAEVAPGAQVFGVFFLTEREHQLALSPGPAALERLFEERRVDPMALLRPSAVGG